MNRKYDNTLTFSFRKAISFKTAAVIVLGLHLIGFFGITQWSAYKTKLSREKRQEEYAKRMELAEAEKFNWPEGKSKIVATSPTPNPVSSVTTSGPSNVGVFDKIVSLFSFNNKMSTVNPTIAIKKDFHEDEIYNKKMAEIATLVDHATNRLSQKAKELAALEASLKEKQKQLDKQTKDQSAVIVKTELPQQQIVSRTIRTYKNEATKTSQARPVSSAVASSRTPKTKNHTSYSEQITTSSPIVISPDTVKTYTKNGMQYIDVVDTSKILSSHIVLQ